MTEDYYSTHYSKFIKWARENLGQGYSLETDEGNFIDPVTCWAHIAYSAGLKEGSSND